MSLRLTSECHAFERMFLVVVEVDDEVRSLQIKGVGVGYCVGWQKILIQNLDCEREWKWQALNCSIILYFFDLPDPMLFSLAFSVFIRISS